jgi:nucleoid DNA-binding protein
MAKKKSAAAKSVKVKAASAPRSKSQVYGDLAEATALSRKQVAGVFEGLADMIACDLGKKGPGLFTVPGLMKIKVVRKPATKARKGVNPFTGEEMMFKAKPARNVVKVLALKNLKSMV